MPSPITNPDPVRAPAARPRFSNRMRVGAAVATVVATLLLIAILLLGGRPTAGGPFGRAASPGSTAASASATGFQPTMAESAEPSPTMQPTATLGPTPTPASPWKGVDWASGTVQLDCDDCAASITDALWWNGQHVAVGAVWYFEPNADEHNVDVLRSFTAALFTSNDGGQWSVAHQGNQIDFRIYAGLQEYGAILDTEVPQHLIALPSGLLAVAGDNAHLGGRVRLWEIPNEMALIGFAENTWPETWWAGAPDYGGNVTLVDVAGGRHGAVAIGFEGGGCCNTPPGPPVVTYSYDGHTWERLDLPSMDERARLMDVVAYDGGFVIVGASRGPAGTEPEVGKPAAWTSSFGLSWVAADVEGSSVPGGALTQVVAGAHGFFAVGVAQVQEYAWQSSGWASIDGHSWNLLGELGVDLPRIRLITSDGTHMTAFGTTSLYTLELAGWSSTDGVEWAPLNFVGETQLPNGDTRYLNPDGTEGYTAGMTALGNAWAGPTGVVIAQPMPAPGGGQSVWFAAATGP